MAYSEISAVFNSLPRGKAHLEQRPYQGTLGTHMIVFPFRFLHWAFPTFWMERSNDTLPSWAELSHQGEPACTHHSHNR